MRWLIIMFIFFLLLPAAINQIIKYETNRISFRGPFNVLPNDTVNGSIITAPISDANPSSFYGIYFSVNSIYYQKYYTALNSQFYNISLNYTKGNSNFEVKFTFSSNYHFSFVGVDYIIVSQEGVHCFITFQYSLKTTNNSEFSGIVDYGEIVGQSLSSNSTAKMVYSILGMHSNPRTTNHPDIIDSNSIYLSGSVMYFNVTGLNGSQIFTIWLSVAVFQVTLVANELIYYFDIYSFQMPTSHTLKVIEPIKLNTGLSGVNAYIPLMNFSFNFSNPLFSTLNSSNMYQWNPSNYSTDSVVTIGSGVLLSGSFGCQKIVQQDFTINCQNECNSSVTPSVDSLANITSLDWRIGCNVCFYERICTKVYCGNGYVESGQQCDSGFENGVKDNGCTNNCTAQFGYHCEITNQISNCFIECGDGVVAGEEACDEGKNNGGFEQGCSSSCTILPGYYCNISVNGSSQCHNVCGDALVAGKQQCDFGPYDPTHITGCSVNCTDLPGYDCLPTVSSTVECNTTCGDSYVAGKEQCDMGSAGNGKDLGCSSVCTIDYGYNCVTNENVSSTCTNICGDGWTVAVEQCDDGSSNGQVGDGCTKYCGAALGYYCNVTNHTSVCVTRCGDGLVVGKQYCDFVKDSQIKGCSSNCTKLNGFYCNISIDARSDCWSQCGDGIRVGLEQCDVGSSNGGNGSYCSASCTILPGFYCNFSNSPPCTTHCGDSLVAGVEKCDTVSNSESDGCFTNCTIVRGFYCSLLINLTSQCTTHCGDGVTAGSQQCDMSSSNGPSGACSSKCEINIGYNCTISNKSSICQPICGDGLTVQGQQCDDGGLNGKQDGCSAQCTINQGYRCVVVNRTSTCQQDTNSLCLKQTLSQPCIKISLPNAPLSQTSFIKIPDQNAIQISLQSPAPMITISRRLLVSIDPNVQYLLPPQITFNFPYQSAVMAVLNAYQIKLTVFYNVSLNDITNFKVSINSYETTLPQVTDNNLALKLYNASQYSKAAFLMKFISILVYIAFGFTVLIFFFSSQLIALELQFLFQFIYGCLITIRKMEPSIMPFTSLWIFNGYYYPIDDGMAVPPRLVALGYHAEFISNFNINLIIFLLPLTIGLSLILYQKIFKKRGNFAQKTAKKLLEEWQLTAIIFCLQPLVYAFIINLQYSSSIGLGIGLGIFLFGIVGVYNYKFYSKSTQKNPTKQSFGDFKTFFRKGNLNFYLIIIIFRITLNLAMLLGAQSIVSHSIIILVLFLWMILTVWKRPYETRHEIISMINSVVLLLITIFFLISRNQADMAQVNFATYIPIAILIALGAMFIANLTYGIVHMHHLVKVSRQKQLFEVTVHKEAASQIFEDNKQVMGNAMMTMTEENEVNSQQIMKIFQTTHHYGGDESSGISTKGNENRGQQVLSSIGRAQDVQSGTYLQNNSPIKNLMLPTISEILIPTVDSGFKSQAKA